LVLLLSGAFGLLLVWRRRSRTDKAATATS
jgi:hypothetical protein